MSQDQLETAVQSALDEGRQTFAAGIAESDDEAMGRALRDALVDPAEFEVRLERHLRAIPNLTVDFSKEAILKVIGEAWDNYVEPWNFPAIPDSFESAIKAAGRSVVLYVASVVLNRIWKT